MSVLSRHPPSGPSLPIVLYCVMPPKLRRHTHFHRLGLPA
jgi:hypothetical protein